MCTDTPQRYLRRILVSDFKQTKRWPIILSLRRCQCSPPPAYLSMCTDTPQRYLRRILILDFKQKNAGRPFSFQNRFSLLWQPCFLGLIFVYRFSISLKVGADDFLCCYIRHLKIMGGGDCDATILAAVQATFFWPIRVFGVCSLCLFVLARFTCENRGIPCVLRTGFNLCVPPRVGADRHVCINNNRVLPAVLISKISGTFI